MYFLWNTASTVLLKVILAALPNLFLLKSKILLAAKGGKSSQWRSSNLLRKTIELWLKVTSEFWKNRYICFRRVVALTTTNPSGSIYVNVMTLLPCCVIAEWFYEETVTPFPGDKSRLSLWEMVNLAWIHRPFKVLTLVDDVNWVYDFV